MDYEKYEYSDGQNSVNGQSSAGNPNNDVYNMGGYPYGNNETPDRKKKRKKGDGKLSKTVYTFMLAGVVFGVFAGAAFYLITHLIHFVDNKFGDGDENTVITEEQEIEQVPDTVANYTEPEKAAAVVTDVTEVVDRVMPSIVSITSEFTEITSFFGQNFENEAKSSGSGIILGKNDEELLIVSNYHVVADSDKLMVQFINGEVNEAQIKGTDSKRDLAVIAVRLSDLKADTKNKIAIAKMGDSSALKVGEPAIAIGNALGYGQSVTTGVISALNRQIEMSDTGDVSGELIQTDAAINPGNSGGALLNVRGEVIGINSNKIGGGVVEGMGYAIPISSAQPIIENLMNRETKDKVREENKGYLGVTGINVTPDVSKMYGIPKGVYVTQVHEGTAAEKGGIYAGDIIVELDGSGVGSMEDLQGYLQYYEKGESVEVTVMRANSGTYEEQKLTVTLCGSFSID